MAEHSAAQPPPKPIRRTRRSSMKHTPHPLPFRIMSTAIPIPPKSTMDGPKFRISMPAGEGRERIELLVNAFVVALWGDTCP